MKPTAPAIIIATIPKARWWTWTPLSLTTLPGHQGTLGLRISRVLILMKEKERMKPTKTRKRPSLPSATIWSFQKSVRIEAE